MAKTDSIRVTQIDPAVIVADDNIRFNLLEDRVDALAEEIKSEGAVINPIEVTKLPKDEALNGYQYRVYTGHYRHAAIMKLNAAGAGMTIPAMVVEASDDRVAVIKHKVAENVARQDMTPMDIARAMKQLVDAGVPRAEIQNIFPVKGGRRGSVSTQPASPAYVWMHLRFNELTKTLQNGLHDGSIPVTAGLEFVKIMDKTVGDTETRKQKMNALLEDIDAERRKVAEAEAKENERYLDSEAKRVAAEQKDAERKQKEEDAKKAVAELDKLAAEKQQAVLDAFSAGRGVKGEEKKAAKETLKAAQADAEAIEKKLQAARKDLEKLVGAPDKPKVPTPVRPKELKVSPAAPVKPSEVKQAAARASGESSVTPLNLIDLRKGIDEMTMGNANYPITQQIAVAYQSFKDGKLSTKQLFNAVAKAVGEK